MATSTAIMDMSAEVEIPHDGIISRTIHNDDRLKVVLFGFDAGQELSEHTASVPATIHILSGQAVVTLGDDQRSAGPGFWAWMPAELPHTVEAAAPTVMLLYMIKG
ncbi:MAG: cupin domain-containing protein [Chthonomonadales bacterium]|nr:cupin domain-containing protein [Chthonomonadales bacterium]